MARQLSEKALKDLNKGIARLILRTVMVGRNVERIRLEASYWDALDEICEREDLTLQELCLDLRDRLSDTANGQSPPSMANGIRVFIVGYYRKSATETGHDRAGHGRGDPFQSTPFDGPAIH